MARIDRADVRVKGQRTVELNHSIKLLRKIYPSETEGQRERSEGQEETLTTSKSASLMSQKALLMSRLENH